MAVYLHDGAISGHTKWSVEAIIGSAADALIVSPFFTPRTARPAHPDADRVAGKIRAAGGKVLFDATTHGLRLPGVDNLASYDTWDLWAGARGDLSTDGLIEEHVQRVFDRQMELQAPRLTPTLSLDSPTSTEADIALKMAEVGNRLGPHPGHSLSGRRGFWLSEDLDAYVGALAQLRAPVWVVTQVFEEANYPPDMTDSAQLAALCRTVDSLSRRSRVIIAQADFFGLPAVAAGANTIGSGWHTKQRVCAPATYQRGDPDQIRRQAQWFTFGGLMTRVHSVDVGVMHNADVPLANRLYPGQVDSRKPNMRLHHLKVLGDAATSIDAHSARADRVAALRSTYESAAIELDALSLRFNRTYTRQRLDFVDRPLAALRAYAQSEGIWR